MEELLFYTVDKNYIKYLSKFEKHVSYNKDEIGHSRPYLGIVLRIENYEYFVPLYSYKCHYEKYKNNPSFFFVYGRKNIRRHGTMPADAEPCPWRQGG